jgi:excisionase family DNA binding protein
MGTEYFTPDEVATQLKVTRQVVYNWINEGRLRAVKAGRTLRVPGYALDAFLQPVRAGEVEPDRGYPIEQFTAAAQAVFEAANSLVRARRHARLEVEHLLCALLRQSDGIARQAFQQLRVDPDQVAQQIESELRTFPSDTDYRQSTQALAISPRIVQVIKRAEELANRLPDLQIDSAHLLVAICEEAGGTAAEILRSFAITPERLEVVLIDLRAVQHSQPIPQLEQGRDAWAHVIEQRLAHLETEFAALRALLTRQERASSSTS